MANLEKNNIDFNSLMKKAAESKDMLDFTTEYLYSHVTQKK